MYSAMVYSTHKNCDFGDNLSGWWLTYPSEEYASQLGLLFHILWKIKFMFQTTNQQ
jgi:hypothetical protein